MTTPLQRRTDTELRHEVHSWRDHEGFDARRARNRDLAARGWISLLCRTSPLEPGGSKHAGLSFRIVPRERPTVEVRPIAQLTGGSESNDVFFTGARTRGDLVVSARAREVVSASTQQP